MTRSTLITLAVLLAAGSVHAGAPELMERAVLPATPDLPTCACVVPLSEGDQLVVGLANGQIVSFHETAGRVIPRTASLPGAGPVDALVACRVGRAASSANEFALLAVRGNKLFSIGFSDMSVACRTLLPAPAGRYRFARATRRPHTAASVHVGGADHPVLFDDDSAMSITVETRTLTPRVEPVIDGAPGLAVTALSDRETVAAGSRVIECAADGTVITQLDERTDPADEPVRVVIARVLDDARTLELKVQDPDSVWVSRSVAAPGRISVAVSIADSVVAMGGTVPLTPSHDIGWVALVDSRGRVFARTDHASPVTNITRVSDFIAVQGDGRNLSVYDMDLTPLWDHDSPVTDAVLLSGHFAGGEAADLAVVGTRIYRVSTADADSIRRSLDMPDFMAGAKRVDGGYELKRSFITFFVSNEEKLRTTLADGSEAAADAFASGELDQAVEHATTARAAAAVLGRREEVARLSSQIHRFVSYEGRRRSLVLAAFVLAVLGVWVTVDCLKGGMSVQLSIVSSLLLFATGAAVSRMLGGTGLNPLVAVGGAAAMVCPVHAQLRPGAVRRRVPGAAIEDLIRALMEFLHGAGEGVPSDGVVDAARKSVTKVAYLAQEMVDSMDDAERYAMLRERFRSRGEDFLDTTYPRVALLQSLAKRTGFIVTEAERMSRAAERMRGAISTVLRDAAPEQPIIKQQLTALREARDSLASAADRAWAVVQTNPGCSLTQSVTRIRREKEDDLDEAEVRVNFRDGVPREQDAVVLWSFQFRFILENLVTNAIRAMSDSREKTITVETATDGTMCTVRFSDTGCGMTEQIAVEIFRSRSEERGGGSGLPSSRALLQERGGNLMVERTVVGEGTTFKLTIPHWTPYRGEQ